MNPKLVRAIYSVALVLLLGFPGIAHSQDQTQPSSEWSNPVNLSRSGAASQPRLFTTLAGGLQVFWWDQFDGMMTSTSGEDGSWSEPVPSKIRSNKLAATPELFVDPTGAIFAFWTEIVPTSASSYQTVLMYSEKPSEASPWSIPRKLADSIAGYDFGRTSAGEIYLAYIRTQNTPQAPAGIYVTKKAGPRSNWANPAPIYTSRYIRLLTPEQAQINIGSTGTPTTTVNTVFWFDPLSRGVLLSSSADKGTTWIEPQLIQEDDSAIINPRLLPGERAFLTWESSLQGGCTLYQQELHFTETSEAKLAVQLGALEPTLEGIARCPGGNEHFETSNGKLYWIWGEGSSRLFIAARAAAVQGTGQERWSEPGQFSVAFEDPQTGQQVSLDDLHARIIGEQLFVVGTDTTSGEVWITQTQGYALELTDVGPSPWSEVQSVSLSGQPARAPWLAMDGKGRTHAVWSVAASASAPGAALFYAQSSAEGSQGPFEIVPSIKGDIARQPTLLYEGGRQILHLVWSGGVDGSLFYSWVGVNEAASTSSWSAPLALTSPPDSSWPQLVQNTAGALYVLFIVPLNETRGVYLSRSTDGGASWSDPSLVFDARRDQAQMLAYPTLATGPGGELHAAWVNARLPGIGGALSIQYARSTDGGISWSLPVILAGEGFSWPRLAVAAGLLHLIYASESGENGVIYQRSVSTELDPTQASAWSAPLAIPGMHEVALPYGLAASGAGGAEGRLYLLGADAHLGILYYTAWQAESWTPVENHAEVNTIGEGLAVGAAAAPRGGQLSAGWLAYPIEEEQENPDLFFLTRSIATLAGPVAMTPVNTATAPANMPTPSPSPEPTVIPSPTPDLNQVTPAPALDLPMPPMVLGGILVAFVVVAIFGGRFVFKQLFSRPH